MKITVLRLGHRPLRDKRISTHVALVARAFGADKLILSGSEDSKLIEAISKINRTWGSDFLIEYKKDWKGTISEHKAKNYQIIHLTMYGIPIQHSPKIKDKKDKLIIVGGQKVPIDVYELSDLNIAITNQPHSEVSSLAILLDRILGGSELDYEFENALKKIEPQTHGKKILSRE